MVWTSGGGSPICARRDDQLRTNARWGDEAGHPLAIGQLMGKVRGPVRSGVNGPAATKLGLPVRLRCTPACRWGVRASPKQLKQDSMLQIVWQYSLKVSQRCPLHTYHVVGLPYHAREREI